MQLNLSTLNPLEYAALTDILADAGQAPWDVRDTFVPTIRIERRGLRRWSPSCRTVEIALALRSACRKVGLTYYTGSRLVGPMACSEF